MSLEERVTNLEARAARVERHVGLEPMPANGSPLIAKIVPRVRIMPPRSHDDPNTPEDDREPRGVAYSPTGDNTFAVTFTDGTDHMHNGSVLSVEADYLDANGNGLRIDLDPSKTPPGERNHPELLGKIAFRAFDDKGRGVGSIGGTGLATVEHIDGDVHWLDPQPPKGPGAYRRSGGVWAECVVRGEGRRFGIEILAPGGTYARVLLPVIG